jgi:Ca2+-binding RTX toxin-like protein
MRGLAGGDFYVVDNAGDVADEGVAGSNGTDMVQSSITFSLSDAVHAKGSIEKLTLTGTAAINGTGNGLANTLLGNAAANRLNGLGGSDTLTGGLANDTFRFDTALNAANVDSITDFDVNAPSPTDSFDRIELENAIFTLLPAGNLAANRFAVVGNPLDFDNGSTITYVSSNGNLYYDTNGATGGGATIIADLPSGLALTNVDFLVT